MSRSPLLLLAACLIAIQLAGCTTTESWRSRIGKSSHSTKSKSMEQRIADCDAEGEDEVPDEDEGYDDPGHDVSDESRAGLASEEPLDPWYGKYNYADKGRAIERNLR